MSKEVILASLFFPYRSYKMGMYMSEIVYLEKGSIGGFGKVVVVMRTFGKK